MKKRGPIIMIGGATLIIISLAVSYSVMERAGSDFSQGGFFPSPESMFDEVSETETIYPDSSYEFSHTTTYSQVPLMWGLYITDYKDDDHVSVSVSNILGEKFGSFKEGDPIFIKSFVIPKVDTYNFNVQNDGKSAIMVKMMYSENPEKSKALTDPNSPFNKNIVPLAVSGFMLIIGVITVISGAVLSIKDWRKGSNPTRYI